MWSSHRFHSLSCEWVLCTYFGREHRMWTVLSVSYFSFRLKIAPLRFFYAQSGIERWGNDNKPLLSPPTSSLIQRKWDWNAIVFEYQNTSRSGERLMGFLKTLHLGCCFCCVLQVLPRDAKLKMQISSELRDQRAIKLKTADRSILIVISMLK